jgi:hypothetical protein
MMVIDREGVAGTVHFRKGSNSAAPMVWHGWTTPVRRGVERTLDDCLTGQEPPDTEYGRRANRPGSGAAWIARKWDQAPAGPAYRRLPAALFADPALDPDLWTARTARKPESSPMWK